MKPSELVFTLQEENQTQTSTPNTAPSNPSWEASLEQLRNRNHAAQKNLISTASSSPSIAHETTHTKIFGDSELDKAYSEYLKQRQLQHNANQTDGDDVGILIQEDWLAAQTALQSDHNRRHLTARQTLILDPVAQTMQEAASNTENNNGDNENKAISELPPYAIHVYDLPDLPSTRKIKILSERELMHAIAERLKPHLSSVISGMVRQALQKKFANLAYDLQMELSEETPQVVQEILDHNLNTIFRICKEKASKPE